MTCDHNCKARWVKGKGSFEGWMIKLCWVHQIIHDMRKDK